MSNEEEYFALKAIADAGINYDNRDLDAQVPPPEWQRKGALIHDISLIQSSLNKGCVDEVQFEALWTLSIEELSRIVCDQASQLERAKAKLRF